MTATYPNIVHTEEDMRYGLQIESPDIPEPAAEPAPSAKLLTMQR